MIRFKPPARAARLSLFSLLLFIAAAAPARARQQPTPAQTPKVDAAQAVESGEFRLHKFEQPIGVESYTVTRDGDSLVVRSAFEFTDRGTKVPLSATLRARQDLTPQSFEIKGKVADLVIVGGNPLEDIHNTRRVRWVVSNGRVFDAAPLWESVGFKP